MAVSSTLSLMRKHPKTTTAPLELTRPCIQGSVLPTIACDVYIGVVPVPKPYLFVSRTPHPLLLYL